MRQLRLVPDLADNAFGFHLALSSTTAAPRVVAKLKESLTHVQKALQDKSNNLEVDMLKLKENLDEWEDRVTAKKAEHVSKQNRLESLDQEYEQRKQEVAAEMEALKRLSDEASKEIAEMRTRHIGLKVKIWSLRKSVIL